MDTVVAHLLFPGKTTSVEDVCFLLKRMNAQDAKARKEGAQIFWMLAMDGEKCVGGVRSAYWPDLAAQERKYIDLSYLPEDFPQREYAEYLLPKYAALRSEAAQGPHAAIELLWVEPEYRKLGIANKLVAESVRKADEAGLVCFVEPSPVAANLYKRNGFEDCDQQIVVVPEKYEKNAGGRSQIQFTLFRRPATAPGD